MKNNSVKQQFTTKNAIHSARHYTKEREKIVSHTNYRNTGYPTGIFFSKITRIQPLILI